MRKLEEHYTSFVATLSFGVYAALEVMLLYGLYHVLNHPHN